MRLSIIIIGDEILLGQVIDTNSGEISRILGAQGWATKSIYTVGDDRQAISSAVARAMEESQLVITTGGLGPTKDDITKKVLTEYFGGELVMDPSVSRNIERVFGARGLQLNELTRLQALVPTSCRVIQNELGTAPIMWFEKDGRVLVSMPGVPFETVGMMHRSVSDEIRRHFQPDIALLHHTLIVAGITESALAQKLSEFEDTLPPTLHLAYLPVPGYIRLRLDGASARKSDLNADFSGALERLRALVADYMIHDGDATPEQMLLKALRERHLSVASAESCTGGNIAHRITSLAGSSDCFLGTVVSYANSVKTNMLGVPACVLAEHGAVSEPVVRQMAEGVAAAIGADCSMATSGIAGPGGGTPDKPVGTVWMAVHTPRGTRTACRRFPGDRQRVIQRATTEVMLMLVDALKDL